MWSSGLLLHWELPLGRKSLGFNYLFIFPPTYVALFHVYNSVQLNTFILLYNHHSRLPPELFYCPRLKLCTHQTLTPVPPFPQSLVVIILLSVSMNVTTPGTLHNKKKLVMELFHLALFLQISFMLSKFSFLCKAE